MATKPRKTSVVSRKVSDEEKLNSKRWEAFLQASGMPFSQLTEEWKDFFDGQSDTATASTELVRLIDIAIMEDEKK